MGEDRRGGTFYNRTCQEESTKGEKTPVQRGQVTMEYGGYLEGGNE